MAILTGKFEPNADMQPMLTIEEVKAPSAGPDGLQRRASIGARS